LKLGCGEERTNNYLLDTIYDHFMKLSLMRTLAVTSLATISLLLPQAAHGYYNPSTGRWLSRDPIEERGGPNLFTLLSNDPENHVDLLGQLKIKYTCRSGRSYLGMGGCRYFCLVDHQFTASELWYLSVNSKQLLTCLAQAAGVMNAGCFFDVDPLFSLGCNMFAKCFQTYSKPIGIITRPPGAI
jgi:hypothetical protein